MRACKRCGHENEDWIKFCPECGFETSASKDSADELSVGARQTFGGRQEPNGRRGSEDGVSVGDARTLTSVDGGGGSVGNVRGTPLSDRYELLEQIGIGGFARVWKARDKKLGRVVAVKRLLPDTLDGGGNEQALVRFRREAQAIAQLNHRNVVAVFDHDRDADGDYIVMEYVDGGTLRKHLETRGGALSVPEAIEMARGIVQGLDHAHRKNLIHRDIKPANILLQEAPEDVKKQGLAWIPKIVDFGLARAGVETGVSVSGYGMGTPAYMPPEQRRDAKKVNHTADYYAVGKTLYEMVSGQPPDDVDPEKIPSVAGLAEVIFKCIKSNAEERYFSAEEVLAALGRVGGERAAFKREGAAKSNDCPACGVTNPDSVKFCEGCGAGLTRVCPECGRENAVHKQFCGGCGTDVGEFLAAQDMLVRIRKYAEEKRWSRVQKESKNYNSDARLNGAKGKELLRTLGFLSDEAARMLREREQLEAAIKKAAAQDSEVEEALRLIARYQAIDPHKDWTEEVRILEKRVSEYDFAETHSEAERAAQKGNFAEALRAWKTYLTVHSQSEYGAQARENIARFEKVVRDAEDDQAFEKAKRDYAEYVQAGDFRAAEKVFETYSGQFARHVEAAATLKKRAVDLDEERRRQQQVQLELKLRRLKRGVIFGVAVLLAVLAVRSGTALWRIYLFEAAIGNKDLEASQQAAKRLIWFCSSENAQTKINTVATYHQRKAAFLSLLGDKAAVLKECGGSEWPAVLRAVAEADGLKDPVVGAKVYGQSTETLRRILEQVQAFQGAREAFKNTIAAHEKDLVRYGGLAWGSVQQAVAKADMQNDPVANAAVYAEGTQEAAGILGRIKVFTEERDAYRRRVGGNEQALAKYGGDAWASVEKAVAAAESEPDPTRGATLYTRAGELVRPIIATCERALAARLQGESLRSSLNAVEFAKYAPLLWRQADALEQAAVAEGDALKAASLYVEVIAKLEKVGPEIKNRKEAEANMLNARDAYRYGLTLVDEGLAKKHVPDEWRMAQEQAAKADQDSSEVSRFETCQAAYESASKAVDALRRRLEAMRVAQRQFEKKLAIFEEEFKDIERAAPAEWKQIQVGWEQALAERAPEECVRLFRELGMLLEKTVKAYDQMKSPSDIVVGGRVKEHE